MRFAGETDLDMFRDFKRVCCSHHFTHVQSIQFCRSSILSVTQVKVYYTGNVLTRVDYLHFSRGGKTAAGPKLHPRLFFSSVPPPFSPSGLASLTYPLSADIGILCVPTSVSKELSWTNSLSVDFMRFAGETDLDMFRDFKRVCCSHPFTHVQTIQFCRPSILSVMQVKVYCTSNIITRVDYLHFCRGGKAAAGPKLGFTFSALPSPLSFLPLRTLLFLFSFRMFSVFLFWHLSLSRTRT